MVHDSMENDHFFEPKSNKKKYSVDFDFRCLNERRYFKITMIRQKPTKQSYFKVDWPLISDRIVAFLLQFEMLNTSGFNISSKTSQPASQKLAKMAENDSKSHISAKGYHQTLLLNPSFNQNWHIYIAIWNIEHHWLKYHAKKQLMLAKNWLKWLKMT